MEAYDRWRALILVRGIGRSRLFYTPWSKEDICLNGEAEKKIKWVNRTVLAIRSRIELSRRGRTIRAAGQAMATLSGPAPQRKVAPSLLGSRRE